MNNEYLEGVGVNLRQDFQRVIRGYLDWWYDDSWHTGWKVFSILEEDITHFITLYNSFVNLVSFLNSGFLPDVPVLLAGEREMSSMPPYTELRNDNFTIKNDNSKNRMSGTTGSLVQLSASPGFDSLKSVDESGESNGEKYPFPGPVNSLLEDRVQNPCSTENKMKQLFYAGLDFIEFERSILPVELPEEEAPASPEDSGFYPGSLPVISGFPDHTVDTSEDNPADSALDPTITLKDTAHFPGNLHFFDDLHDKNQYDTALQDKMDLTHKEEKDSVDTFIQDQLQQDHNYFNQDYPDHDDLNQADDNKDDGINWGMADFFSGTHSHISANPGDAESIDPGILPVKSPIPGEHEEYTSMAGLEDFARLVKSRQKNMTSFIDQENRSLSMIDSDSILEALTRQIEKEYRRLYGRD